MSGRWLLDSERLSLRPVGLADVEPPLVGIAGYWHFHEPPQLQLTYALDPAHWGRGLGLEAARAVVRYGFGVLRFDRIGAGTDAPNVRSVALLERLGMRPDPPVRGDGDDALGFVLTREDFDRAALHA